MNKTLKFTVAAALLFWSAGLFAQTFDIVECRKKCQWSQNGLIDSVLC